MATTVYDLAIKIALQGVAQAKAAMKGLGGSIKGAGDALGKLGLAAAGLRTALAPLGYMKTALIDFNSELESAKIGMATMASMNLRSMGVGFQDAMKMSELMISRFQVMAVKSPATTKDYVDMAQGIAGAAYSAGLSTERLMKLTEGSVIAGTAFGIRADVMALDVSQALRGVVTSRDRIGSLIKAATGMDAKKFNALSGTKRAAAVEKTLNDPAIKAAAEAYANTYQGQMSTLKDTLQMTLGKVGLPLMKMITAEVAKWNAWVSKHPEKIKQWAKDFSGALVKGFGMVKQVFGWIVAHRETLMNVAFAFAALKVGTGIAGILGPIIGGLGAFSLALAAATVALLLMNRKSGVVGAVERVIEDHKRRKKEEGAGIMTATAAGRDHKWFNMGVMKRHGIDLLNQWGGTAAGITAVAAGRAAGEAARKAEEDRINGQMGLGRPGENAGRDASVNINKIELNVKSDAPDAFAEQFTEFLSSFVRTNDQADTAYRNPWQ